MSRLCWLLPGYFSFLQSILIFGAPFWSFSGHFGLSQVILALPRTFWASPGHFGLLKSIFGLSALGLLKTIFAFSEMINFHFLFQNYLVCIIFQNFSTIISTQNYIVFGPPSKHHKMSKNAILTKEDCNEDTEECIFNLFL